MEFLVKFKQLSQLNTDVLEHLKPFMELYKKYDNGFARVDYPEIKIEDGSIYFGGDEYYCGGIESHGQYFVPELFSKDLQYFENHLISQRDLKIETEKLAKEKQQQEWEESQRKQYECLKKKFENT
jgi:hypothetical protein